MQKFIAILFLIFSFQYINGQEKNGFVSIDTVSGYFISEYEICTENYYVPKTNTILDKKNCIRKIYSDVRFNVDNISKKSKINNKAKKLSNRLFQSRTCNYKFFKRLYYNLTPTNSAEQLYLKESFVIDITNDNGFNRLNTCDFLYTHSKDKDSIPSNLFVILKVNLIVFHCFNFLYNEFFGINENDYIVGSENWCYYPKINSDVNNFYLLYDSLEVTGVKEKHLNIGSYEFVKYPDNKFWTTSFE